MSRCSLVPDKGRHDFQSEEEICPTDLLQSISVAARSKAWVCGRSLAGTVSSNPVECMDVCAL